MILTLSMVYAEVFFTFCRKQHRGLLLDETGAKPTIIINFHNYKSVEGGVHESRVLECDDQSPVRPLAPINNAQRIRL